MLHRSSLWTMAARIVLVCLACSLAGLVRADERAEALAIVESAIKAVGDPEKQAKYLGLISEGKATLNLNDMKFELTMKAHRQLPDKSRVEIEFEVMGQQIEIINIFNKDKGWAKVADDVNELTEDQIREAQDQAYSDLVSNLLVLRDPSFKLSLLGKDKDGEAELVGVLVQKKDRPDIKLWFRSTTNLLHKLEMKAHNSTTGALVDQVVYYLDYRDWEGLKVPFKFKIYHDGRPFLDVAVESVKLAEKLDDSLFQKP